MKSIDSLIYDALAGMRSVLLPGEGTLEIRRRGAKKISDTRMIPPQSVVVFTPHEAEGAENILSLMMATGEVDYPRAAELYGEWLDSVRRPDGSMAIEGVGETGDGGFIVDETLHKAINPNLNIVTMENERRSTPLWAWIVIGLLAALFVMAVLWSWKAGVFGCSKPKEPVEVVMQSTMDEVTAAVAATATHAVAAAQAAASAGFESEARAAGAAAGTAAGAAGAATAASSAVSAQNLGPRFHVIAGAFAIESNADNFVARLRRDHPELTTEKMINPSNGFHMVSIFQSPSLREANEKMNLYWDIDLFLWVYEQR
jgi:cell division septation protein DedD